MGLVDFAVELGKKLFGRDDEAPETIKAAIEAADPGVKDPDLNYRGQKIRIPLN